MTLNALERSLQQLQENYILHGLKITQEANLTLFEAYRPGLLDTPAARLFFLFYEQLVLLNKDQLTLAAFENLQSQLLGQRFFQETTSVRWNYYLYIVYEPDDNFAVIEKEAIESDFHYARKRFVKIDELEEMLKIITADKVDDSLPDPEAEWLQALEPFGLSGCLYLKQYTAHIDNYVDKGVSICANDNDTKNIVSKNIPAPQRITELNLKNYRENAFDPVKTINFSAFNLFDGVNGSGKSSIIDAVEFAMTGSIKRFNESGGNAEGEAIVEANTTQGDVFKLSSNCNSSEKKNRGQSWYNMPSKGEGSISDKFEHFNRFSIESVFSLITSQCVDHDDALQTSMSRLCFGDDISQMEKNWLSCLKVFCDKKKSLDKTKNEMDEKISALSYQIEADTENIHQRQIDLHELYVSLFGQPPLLTNDFARLEDVYRRSQQDIISLNTLNEAISPQQLNERFNKLQGQFAELKKQAEQSQNLLNRRITLINARNEIDKQLTTTSNQINDFAAEMAKITDLQKALQELGLSEGNIESQYTVAITSYKALGKIIEDYQTFWEMNLNESLVSEAKLNAEIQDIKEKYLQISSVLAQTAEQLKSLEKQRQEAMVANNHIEQLQAEFQQMGKEILRSTQSPCCPFCGKTYECTEDLLNKANEIAGHCAGVEQNRLAVLLEDIGKAEKFQKEQQKSLEDLDNRRKYLYELTKLYRDCSDYIDLSNLETVRQLCDRLKSQLDTLTTRTKQLFNPHEIWLYLCRNLMKTGLESKSLTGYAEYCDVEINTLREKINILNEKQREYGIQIEDISSTIEISPFSQEALTATEIELGKYQSWNSAVENLWHMGIKIDMNESLLLTRDRIKRLEGVHQAVQQNNRISAAHKELDDFEKNILKIKKQVSRCEAAINALQNLKSTLEYSTDFIESNLRQINLLFKRLHLPPEFSRLQIVNKSLALQRSDSKELIQINQMSMGQKTSLALAILFQMHMMKDTTPRILLFDEPIANLDDIHVMNMMDILCDLVLGGTQIFITTANNDIARYIERRFAFLEDKFTHYQLSRDITKQRVGKVQINKKSISSQIASGE